MNKITFLIPLFLVIGCSTPEIRIPSYNFGTDTNSTENAETEHVSATSAVASIEDDGDTIIPTIEEEVKEEAPQADSTVSIDADISETEVAKEAPEVVAKEEKRTTPPTTVKKSGGFFSLFGSKPKVKNEYFTGGQIRSRLVMDDDSGESGLFYRYGYDGKVTSTVHIKHGIKNGLETLFDPKGMVMKRTPYINGRKDGIVEVYYPDGKVLAQITYVDNKRHGRASKYNHDGTINEEVQYTHGKLIHDANSDDIDIPIID